MSNIYSCKALISFLALFLFFQNANSQDNNLEAIVYNVSFGSVVGGLGALLNKDNDKKWHEVFLKGSLKGAIGGYIVYESKKRIYDFGKTQRYEYAWASKLMYSAGNSMIENAAYNRKLFSYWNIMIGFNRLEFETENKFKINYQLMPLSLIGTIYFASNGKFDFNESLKTGTFIFTTDNKDGIITGNAGIAFRNNILLLNTSQEFYKILPHEIIHIYQNQDFQLLNTFFSKTKNSIIKEGFLKKIDRYIYFDFPSLIYEGLYSLEKSNKCYYNNAFEQEANFYSLRRKCIIN